MPYSFEFSVKHLYPDRETGISLPVFLTYGDKTEKVSAKLDTGAISVSSLQMLHGNSAFRLLPV